MINIKDFIIKENSNGEKRKFYKATCDSCGADRGYKRNKKSYADALCRSCSQSGVKDVNLFPNVDFSNFIQNKKSKSYKTTCVVCKKDKGFLRKRDALKPCLSCARIKAHKSMCPTIKQKLKNNMSKPLPQIIKSKISKTLKGKTFREYTSMSEESKIKMSCTKQNIELKDFNGYLTPESKKERVRFTREGLRDNCFSNADFICDLYDCKGEELNAHHMDSWHDNEDRRFDQDNLVCLSKHAHKTFHHIYGKKNNTKEQYMEFKSQVSEFKQKKQDLFLVAGCPASGKSWVCDQLADKFSYISYDGISKNYHVYELLKNNHKPLLYDPTIKISTFTKRYGHLFNIRLIVIVEDESIINSRMINRGGKITNTIKRRMLRMSNLSKKCEFVGTSSEVLDYLNKKKPTK